jgi:monoamine oxidase
MLKPYQIRNTAHQLISCSVPTVTDNKKLYFAGKALSYCNVWIQGALESGLRAAYQFYACIRNEEGLVKRFNK